MQAIITITAIKTTPPTVTPQIRPTNIVKIGVGVADSEYQFKLCMYHYTVCDFTSRPWRVQPPNFLGINNQRKFEHVSRKCAVRHEM